MTGDLQVGADLIIYEQRARGTSYRTIAETLVRKGTPTKRGGVWAAATVRSLLRAQDGLGSDEAA